MAALIEVLDFGPVHVYGFSYGGLLAQALMLDHAHLIRSTTLANSLHSPKMWQLNHENINREIANQYPEVWELIQALRKQGIVSTDPRMQTEFKKAAPLVRFYDPMHVALLADEPNGRNTELYPIFCGEDVDFIIGGQIPKIPDFRKRLGELTVPLLILAGRFDRALYPKLQQEFIHCAKKAIFHWMEKSGSFSHVEEPHTVFKLLCDFWQNLSK